jgi:uncharacterized protein YjbK
MAIETELKYLLSARAFQKLTKHLETQRISIERQHNVYYDTSSRELGRRRLAVRIRTQKSGSTLTVKLPSSDGRTALGVSVRCEFEARIRTPQALTQFPVPASITKLAPWRVLADTFPDIAKTRLVKKAEMRTLRQSYRLKDRLVLELDEVTLPSGTVFYEAELESPHPAAARRVLFEVFRTAGVTGRPIRRTKLARVLQEQRK